MNTKLRARVSAFLQTADGQLDRALTMVLSLTMATGLSAFVNFRVDNPYSISNVHHAVDGWAPETNYARVLFIIFGTVALYFIIQKLRSKFSPAWFRILVAAFAACSFFIATTAQNFNAVDMFHNGEQLSPTQDFLERDKELFTDIFFLHGAGEDILIPALSSKLLGNSIGTYILSANMLRAASVLLFFLLLALLIRPPGFYLFTVIWFLGASYGFDHRKNIPVYVVLALYWLWLTRLTSLRKRLLALFSIGFLSSLTLINTVDMGVVLSVLGAGVAVALLFNEQQKGLTRRFKWPELKKLSTYYESAALVGGGLIAQLLLLVFLSVENYKEFVRMMIEIPQYQGLVFGYPLSDIEAKTYLFWLPIFLAVFTTYMLVRLFVAEYGRSRTLSPQLCFAGITLALGLLYLRFGVGRPDEPHINLSATIFFLASFYIIQLYVRAMLNGRIKQDVWVVILFILLLFWPQTGWDPVHSFAFSNSKPTEIKRIKALPSKPDEAWLSEEQKAVTRYIKAHTNKNDKIFVFSLEPLYYYLADRENSSRFYISWFTDPQPYTDELLSELKKDPPRLIVYEGPPISEISDGVPVKDRIPEVDKWILENYPKKVKIHDTMLLTK